MQISVWCGVDSGRQQAQINTNKRLCSVSVLLPPPPHRKLSEGMSPTRFVTALSLYIFSQCGVSEREREKREGGERERRKRKEDGRHSQIGPNTVCVYLS